MSFVPYTADDIIADAIAEAVAGCSSLYTTADGETFRGTLVSEVPTALRAKGWTNVGQYDRYDLQGLGFTVVEARYAGGTRQRGRWADVVRLPQAA